MKRQILCALFPFFFTGVLLGATNEKVQLTFFIGLHDVGIAPPTTGSDGVVFRVDVIDGKEMKTVFKKLWKDRRWEFQTVDLSRYDGKEIAVRFVINPGPAGDASGDWCAWGEPKISRGKTVLYDFVKDIFTAKTGIDGKLQPLTNGAKFALEGCPARIPGMEKGFTFCGGEKKRGIYAEPAWDGASAESFGEFVVDLKGTKKKPVSYERLDLRPFCNRGFRDEVSDDKKGGWTDQGSNDMRNFPAGEQVFLNILFTIIDPNKNNGKSTMVLTQEEPSRTIPVGRPAACVYFLHTGAWVENQVAVYTIVYDDGDKISIPVIQNVNIFDWWSPGDLSQCQVAWVGGNPIRDGVGIGVFGWNNPKPEKKIKEIVLAREKGVLMIPAVTLSSSPSTLVGVAKETDTDRQVLLEKLAKLKEKTVKVRARQNAFGAAGKKSTSVRFAAAVLEDSIPAVEDDIYGRQDWRAFARYQTPEFFRKVKEKYLIPSYKGQSKVGWFLKQNRRRAAINLQYLLKLADEALAGQPSELPYDKVYRTGKVEIRDGAIYQNGHPVYLIGICEDMSSLADLGGFTDADRFSDMGISILAPTHNPARPQIMDIYPYRFDDAFIKNYIRAELDAGERGNLAAELLVYPDPWDIRPSYSWKFDYHKMLNPATSQCAFSCLDPLSPTAKEYLETYLRYLIPKIKSSRSLFCYELLNQPHMYPNSDRVKEAFRKQLQEKYGKIESLNAVWKTNFKNFQAIDPPRELKEFKSLGFKYDWLTFQRIIVHDFYRWYKGILNDLDPGRPVTIQEVGDVMYPSLFGAAYSVWRGNEKEDLLEDVEDVAGYDEYTNYIPRGDSAISSWEVTSTCDFFKSVAPDKPIFNWEFYITATNSTAQYPYEYFRSVLWQAAIHGQNGVTFWLWQRWDDDKGNNSGCDSNTVAHYPGRLVGIGKTALELAGLADHVVQFPRDKGQFALLYSRTSKFLDTDPHCDMMRSMYTELFFKGLPIRFVTEKMILAGKAKDYKLVIIPNVKYFPQNAYDALLKYVQAGGTVVYTAGSLQFDEYVRTRNLSPWFDKGTPVSCGKGTILRLPEARDNYDQVLEKAGIVRDFRLVDGSGKVVQGVEWRTATGNKGEKLLFLLNHTHQPKIVRIVGKSEVKNIFDLTENRDIKGPVKVKSLCPMLLKVEK